jgi:hypothetical protein
MQLSRFTRTLNKSRIIVLPWPYLQNFTGRAFQELNVEANSYQTQIVTVYWTKLFRSGTGRLGPSLLLFR